MRDRVVAFVIASVMVLAGLAMVGSPANAAPPAGCFSISFSASSSFTDADGAHVHGSGFFDITGGCTSLWAGHQNQCAAMRIKRVTPSSAWGAWIRVCDTPQQLATVTGGTFAGGDRIQIQSENTTEQFGPPVTGTLWR